MKPLSIEKPPGMLMQPLWTPRIAIILLNWNGKEDTLACLDSLSHVKYPHYEVILLDNGSEDDTVICAKERFPHLHCIENGCNLGFAAGNNVGITYALKRGAELVLLLNNDTVVSPDLLEKFVRCFEERPEAGILGARIYLFDQKDTLDHLGGMWLKKKADMRLIGFRQKEVRDLSLPIDYVCGACMMIKRCVFDAIGLLEPRYFLYWEENDFCLSAKRAGFLSFTCPGALVWHKVSASIIGGRVHSTYFWWRGRLLWIKRHYSFWEKCAVYLRIILPEIFKLLKIHLLKKMQLRLFSGVSSQEVLKKRKAKLRKNKAALTGIRDYFFKRFDKGPDWIYTERT